jgi:gold/copper resistance efflux pump
VRTIRSRLEEIKDARLRLRDLSGPGRFPRCGYPIDLAISGPEPDRVRELARRLGELLGRSKKLTDVWVNPDSLPRPQRHVDIDRAAAAARGVSMEDILSTLRVHAGSLLVRDFNRFGRNWRVELQTEPGSGNWAADAARLRVRNARGQMIPLGVLIKVTETEGPRALDFFDMQPMVALTANPETGVSLAEARKICELLTEGLRKELRLPAGYRLTWLP